MGVNMLQRDMGNHSNILAPRIVLPTRMYNVTDLLRSIQPYLYYYEQEPSMSRFQHW